MSVTLQLQAESSLPFDRFWSWLGEHPNCILQAGTEECFLYDDEVLHWHLGADADGNPYAQLVHGKQLIGELLIEPRVLYVQGRADGTTEEPDRWLFELIGGTADEPYPICHFLMAHGVEEDSAHQGGALKH